MNKFAAVFTLACGVSAFGICAALAEISFGIADEPFAPYSEKSADGSWSGWEIEIGDAVCAAMDEECVWVDVDWDSITDALLEKKIDVIFSSMSITEERLKTIEFTDKYYDTPTVLVARKGSKIDGTAESLDGAVVGVQVDTTHANYVEKHFGNTTATIRTFPTFDEHNQALVAGGVDAIVGPSVAISLFLMSDAGACCEVKARLSDAEIFGQGIGGGLRKEDTELKAKMNAGIRQIREDGTYDEISKRYFDFDIYGE